MFLLPIREVRHTISQNRMTYNAEGKIVRKENLAGQVTTTTWDCCFAYANNNRSELTNAVAAVDSDYRYSYAFDDIGNRETSSERGTNSVYMANNLNQYTVVDDFTPQFDDDGNQTLIKTATGVWSVTYNGENRPIHWQCQQSNNQTITNNQTISMSFDRMGRRVTKNDQSFVYDGYLQIANFELASTNSQLTTQIPQLFIWDPTEPVTTRPLAWTHGNSVAYYTHDGNKNVSEVVEENGNIAAHYEYAPFGAVTMQSGVSSAANPWRFSSEYAEDDTATVYYNYRHYESMMGRWIVRDCIGEFGGLLLCGFIRNSPLLHSDVLGNRITKSFAQYEFSPKHCELRVQLKWYLMFRNDEDHEQWTRAEKSEWKRKVKSAVEGYFNDIPFRCLRSGKCCQCKDGIKVKLKLKFVGYEESWLDAIFGFEYNVKVTVYKDPRYRSFVEGVSGDTFLNEDDGDNDGGGKQITAVHEVGHQLGLNHPGMWSGESENSSADYTSDYNGLPGKYNLMGEGMALHEDDFNRAFCDHINYDECDK